MKGKKIVHDFRKGEVISNDDFFNRLKKKNAYTKINVDYYYLNEGTKLDTECHGHFRHDSFWGDYEARFNNTQIMVGDKVRIIRTSPNIEISTHDDRRHFVLYL